MDTNLSSKKCVPCEIGTPPMSEEKAGEMQKQINGWEREANKLIYKEFTFKDFLEAVEFVNKVAKIAEAEGHHPDIYIFYNKVKLSLSTHAAKGLTENDFILASKVDGIG